MAGANLAQEVRQRVAQVTVCTSQEAGKGKEQDAARGRLEDHPGLVDRRAPVAGTLPSCMSAAWTPRHHGKDPANHVQPPQGLGCGPCEAGDEREHSRPFAH
ncbi:hypothetical protein U5640_36015 [Streptomyces sp. SS7]|uniref:hypothetical protein n=1 Tax=Streptomyces sp. SS7 TaxID=3108485 RepID=UPI0030ECCAA1